MTKDTIIDQLNAKGIWAKDHGSPDNQWGAEFIISAEQYDNNDEPYAEYYHESIREIVHSDGTIRNAFGIREDIHRLLRSADLHAEWIDGGTIGVYR